MTDIQKSVTVIARLMTETGDFMSEKRDRLP